MKSTSRPANAKFPATRYCTAVGEKRSSTVMCICPARMPFKSGSDLRYLMNSCPRYPKVIGFGGSLRNFVVHFQYFRVASIMRGV